jgi:hypothetical protein
MSLPSKSRRFVYHEQMQRTIGSGAIKTRPCPSLSTAMLGGPLAHVAVRSPHRVRRYQCALCAQRSGRVPWDTARFPLPDLSQTADSSCIR